MAIINMKASLVVGDGQPIIRRFTSEEGASLDYQSLLSSLKQLFPDHMKDKFTIHWIDEDGDHVMISCDDDVQVALRSTPPDATLKIVIREADQAGVCHPGVICDICEKGIYGHRYKCVTCRDFDLCPECEKAGGHPHHMMLRITTPRTTQRNVFDECYGSPFFASGLDGAAHCRARRHCPYKMSGPCFGQDPSHHDATFPAAKMNEIAKNIMKNWYEAMRPRTSEAGGERSSAPNEKNEKAKEEDRDENIDTDLFSALLEEICETFTETLKTRGGKRQNDTRDDEDGDTSEASCPKRPCPPTGDNAQVPFDLAEVLEAWKPLAQRLFEGLADANEACAKTDGSKEGKSREDGECQGQGDCPQFEDSWKHGASVMMQLLNDAMRQGEPPANGKEDEDTNDGTSKGASRSSCCGESASRPVRRNLFQGLEDRYRNLMQQRSMASYYQEESDRDRVARTIEQLKSMGFSDENGWLTSLTEAKRGNMGQVLDAIQCSRK